MITEAGDVRGVRYWIYGRDGGYAGFWWTVYVDVSGAVFPDGSVPRHESDVDSLLDVHGGCTFFGKAETVLGPVTDAGDAVIAGWDYAHWDDLVKHRGDTLNELKDLRSRQTLDEVRQDVRSALEAFSRGP